MSRPLNHHHLPVFYLNGWRAPDGRVVRFSRPSGGDVKASPVSPKKTGRERFLYSLEGFPEEQRQVIEEKFFAPVVDGPASRALKVLIERDQSKLTPELRAAWTTFLMAARLRSPEMVDELQKAARRLLEENLLLDPQEYEALRRNGDPPTLLEFAEQRIKPRLDNSGKFLLPDLVQNPKIGEAIIRMKWSTVDLSAAKHELLTSDQPFVMIHGLGDPRCIVAFPLDPRFAFVATHQHLMEHPLANLDADTIAQALNESVVRQAAHSVYGRTKEHLRFVERRLRRPNEPLSALQLFRKWQSTNVTTQVVLDSSRKAQGFGEV